MLLALCVPRGAAADDVVKMAPFIVEASSGTPWRYFSVSGFEVLSRCPDDFNETYARALQQSVAARAILFPPGFLPDLPTPIKIVLYCKPPATESAFTPADPIDLQLEPLTDVFLENISIEQASPVVVDDGDTFINCGNYSSLVRDVRDLSVDPDTDILLQLRTPTFPAWFKTGVTGPYGVFIHRIIQSTVIGSIVARFPSASWISHDETAALQNDPKHPRNLLPLNELFDGSARESQHELWDSEAALFVRWGLLSKEKDGTSHKEAFLRFVDRATTEPTTEQMFRECFGMGFADAQRKLGLYLARAAAETITIPVPAAPNPPVRIRDAKPDEIARIIGDWARFEGRSSSTGLVPGYRKECLDHAAKMFTRTYANGDRSPLFLAAYGLYKAQIGESRAARQALDAATASGVVRPRAYVELARLRLETALPYPEKGIGDLREADYSAIRQLLTAARTQMPSLLRTYQLMARLLEHAPKTPTREDLAVLGEAVRLFPRNAAFACKVAAIYQRCGYPDDAKAIIERAKPFADSADARGQFSDFDSQRLP
jgi:hypothetical protein